MHTSVQLEISMALEFDSTLLALQESFEWADLRTLTDDEIKPHSQHPLPGLSRVLALPAPAQPRAQLSALPVPAVPGATADQVLTARALTDNVNLILTVIFLNARRTKFCA